MTREDALVAQGHVTPHDVRRALQCAEREYEQEQERARRTHEVNQMRRWQLLAAAVRRQLFRT
jgi:hypothetical protein